MPEPLSRDLCERLADLYEEVREHLWADGDLFWRRGENVAWVAFGEADTYWGGAWPINEGDVWCPHLEDLLELAHGVLMDSHLWWDLVESEWVYCGEAPGRDFEGRGHTPAKAVARWLIAWKDGNR